ncbi:MAG: hypothetical protein AAF485_26415, partial [Chloroflexota bacterium]
RQHIVSIRGLALNPQNPFMMVSGSVRGTSILWHINYTPWAERSCQIANRNLTEVEWDTFVGNDTPYQLTCPDLPKPPVE